MNCTDIILNRKSQILHLFKVQKKPRESMEMLAWGHSGRKRAYMQAAPVVLVIFQFLISCFCVFDVWKVTATHDLSTFLYVNSIAIKFLPKSKQTQKEIPLIKKPKIKRTDNSAGKDVKQLKISFTAGETIH